MVVIPMARINLGVLDDATMKEFSDMISFFLWYPDIFLDINAIKNDDGKRIGMQLDPDQRLELRCLCRFKSTYLTLSRGGAKSMLEVFCKFIKCALIPNRMECITANTREIAATIVQEKYDLLISNFPSLQNEVVKTSFSKNNAIIRFKSGGKLFVAPCAQTAKGLRAHGVGGDEFAQLKYFDWMDVSVHYIDAPRKTIGPDSFVNPYETTNLDYFTTAWFKNTDAYDTLKQNIHNMINLNGSMAISANWELPCMYGRGEPRSTILERKQNDPPLFFSFNYENEWIGAVENGLLDIKHLMENRSISTPEWEASPDSEYIISMDVAHSQNENANKSSICVLKLSRLPDNRIRNVAMVNLITLPNGLNFTDQAIAFKRIFNAFSANMAVCDANGLGQGLLDELLKEQVDPDTGEILECWDTVNTTNLPQYEGAKKCLYALTAQGKNSDMVLTFKAYVEGNKLQLLEQNNGAGYDVNSEEYEERIVPCIQTDFFIDEVNNLKLVVNGGKVTVERDSNKLDKDRYSCVAMGIYYIETEENVISTSSDRVDFSSLYRKTKIHTRRKSLFGRK